MWKFHLQKIKNDRIIKNAGTLGMLFLRSSCVYSLSIFQHGATTYMLSTKMLAVYFYIQHNKQIPGMFCRKDHVKLKNYVLFFVIPLAVHCNSCYKGS